MATVILDTRYAEAKKLLQQLKKERYAKVIDNENEIENKAILKACIEAEKSGNVSESEIMKALK